MKGDLYMSNLKEKLNDFKSKMLPATMGLGTAMLMAVPTFAEGTTPTDLASQVTTEMISGVFNQVYALVPKVIPAVILFLAFRKGWSWLKGQLLSA